MKVHVPAHHRAGHNVSPHHVDGYLRKLPGSSKKVRVKGHHVSGHHVPGHHVKAHDRLM